MHDYTLANPLHYVCPYCNAGNGWACSTLDNRPRTSHKARLALAAVAKAKAASDHYRQFTESNDPQGES